MKKLNADHDAKTKTQEEALAKKEADLRAEVEKAKADAMESAKTEDLKTYSPEQQAADALELAKKKA